MEEEEKRKKEEEKNKKYEEFQNKMEEEKRILEEKKEKLLEEQNQLIKILKSQKEIRNKKIGKNIIQDKSNQQENKNEKLKKTLEHMCIMGNIIKNEIIEKKKLLQKNLFLSKKQLNYLRNPFQVKMMRQCFA